MAHGRVAKRSLIGMLSIRRAALKDLDVLVHQRRAMWIDLGVKDASLHDRGDRIYRRWARTRLGNHSLMAWLVETRDGRIAGGGCLWFQPIQPRPHGAAMLQPYLLSMYTEPGFRGHGVASMVVREAIRWCRSQGYERLTLHASEMGWSVYRRLGFKRTWEMRLDMGKMSDRQSGQRPVLGIDRRVEPR